MKLVAIESPYSGDVEGNAKFARACMLDSLRRGEAPLASHLLYTQVLDDLQPVEREMGMRAGWAWNAHAEKVVVYVDRGVSLGMRRGIDSAVKRGIKIEYRTLGKGSTK